MSAPEEWPVPSVTDNSRLLLGFMTALPGQDHPYGIDEVSAAEGFVIVRNKRTGNRFRVTVEQISGTE